jgi:cobalt-zinc-cadmium efflux system outer membrane protein
MAEADLRAPLFVSPAELKALRDNSLAVTALKQQFTAANSQLDYQRGAGWLPELKAGVNAEREDGEWAFGPGVELELPLFDQGQGEVGVAQANLLRLRAQFDAAAVRVHSFSAAAQERRSQARAQVAYLRGTLLPLHERLVAEAQLQYNAMSIGAFELLSAKHEHLRVLQQGVDAELAYWLAEAEWKLLLAGGVPSSENALSGATAAREVAPMSAGGH